MFYKLAKNCILFELKGIPMLGNPGIGALFGLTEDGKELADKLMVGCEVEMSALTESQRQLFQALENHKLFEREEAFAENRAAYLHITSRCNMNCVGCYSQLDRTYNKVDTLSLEELKKIVDNMVNAKIDSIIISGGEPFLRKDIFELLRYMKEEKGIRGITCITNGLADYETYFQAVKYLNCLSFSLDGYCEERSYLRKNSFKKAVDNIVQLKRKGYEVSITFTFHKKNYMDYFEMKKLAEHLGVMYNFSIFQTPHSEETAEYEIGEEQIAFLCGDEVIHTDIRIQDSNANEAIGCKEGCGAGCNMVSIAANGDVLPCHMFMERDFLMGNALTDSLEEIFKRNKRPLVKVEEKQECKECEYRFICGGGCAYRSYVASGSITGLDPLCPLHVACIDRTLEILLG